MIAGADASSGGNEMENLNVRMPRLQQAPHPGQGR